MTIEWIDLPAWAILGSIAAVLAGSVLAADVRELHAARPQHAEERAAFAFGIRLTEESCFFTAILCLFSCGYLYVWRGLDWGEALLACIPMGILVHALLALGSLVYARGVAPILDKMNRSRLR